MIHQLNAQQASTRSAAPCPTTAQTLIRPPVTVLRRSYVLLVMFFFLFFPSPGSLRAPSTDRRETLPHDRKLVRLDKFSPKIRGPKTCKISGDFLPLLTLITNITGKGQDIENRKDMWSRAIPSAFDEKGPVNFGPLPTEIPCEFGPTKMHFLADYISAHMGCCELKFLHALEIDQALIAHTRSGMCVPPKKKLIVKI